MAQSSFVDKVISCLSLFVFMLVLAFSSQVFAQPNTPPPPVEEVPPFEPVPTVEPSQPMPSPVQGDEGMLQTADSAELIARFDRAVELMIQSHFWEAQAEFEHVAAHSVDSERIAAAKELARQSANRFGAKPRVNSIGRSLKKTETAEDKEEGRVSFLTVTTLVGLNYGWMVPLALGVEDSKGFVGLYLLTAASSFTVPYLITRDHQITRGMSTLGSAGSYLGLVHGGLLFGVLGGEDGAEDSDGTRLLVASALAASIAEGAMGYWWAQAHEAGPGQATAIALGTVWGLGYGAGAEFIVEGEDVEFRLVMGGMLAGSVGGMVGGYYYDDFRNPTEGDVSLISYSGILGSYLGLVPLVLAEVDDTRLIAGTILAGASLGLFTGDRLTKDQDYSRGQSGVMVLGSLAGGLLGAGGAFLLSPDDTNLGKWVLAGSAVGAIGGLYTMIHSVNPAGSAEQSGVASAQLTPIIGPNGETGLGIAGLF